MEPSIHYIRVHNNASKALYSTEATHFLTPICILSVQYQFACRNTIQNASFDTFGARTDYLFSLLIYMRNQILSNFSFRIGLKQESKEWLWKNIVLHWTEMWGVRKHSYFSSDSFLWTLLCRFFQKWYFLTKSLIVNLENYRKTLIKKHINVIFFCDQRLVHYSK